MDLKAFYRAELDEHAAVLRATLVQCEAPFLHLMEAAAKSLEGGGKLMFFGNGGSAADAQHLATELTVRYVRDRAPIAAIALTTDTSALTAIGNDLGFDQIFARQVRALGLRPEPKRDPRARGGAGARPRRRGFDRRRWRLAPRPRRSAADRAVAHHRAHPGDAHHPWPDALRRARAQAGAGLGERGISRRGIKVAAGIWRVACAGFRRHRSEIETGVLGR